MICPICSINNYTVEQVAVQGRVAVPGCVEGIVRLVLFPWEADQLISEEVLVTSMTDPDSVPAMERSKAVVTDRGGVLCHAAIVCRELSKPCIVGTRDATAKLKNGMYVRVCATRGVVLVLAQSSSPS